MYVCLFICCMYKFMCCYPFFLFSVYFLILLFAKVLSSCLTQFFSDIFVFLFFLSLVDFKAETISRKTSSLRILLLKLSNETISYIRLLAKYEYVCLRMLCVWVCVCLLKFLFYLNKLQLKIRHFYFSFSWFSFIHRQTNVLLIFQ